MAIENGDALRSTTENPCTLGEVNISSPPRASSLTSALGPLAETLHDFDQHIIQQTAIISLVASLPALPRSQAQIRTQIQTQTQTQTRIENLPPLRRSLLQDLGTYD